MMIDITNIVYSRNFSTEVELLSSYIATLDSFLRWFFAFIGVQMAHPFQQDKKSGVMKSALETSCAMLTSNSRPASGNTPKSRKSVLIGLKSTTLQLGAGGETAE